MYAIVEIAGLQYKVEQDQELYVNRLSAEPGEALSFDKVLLVDNGSVSVGAPVVEGMSVQAEVLEHVKGDKVIIFKKKRRKGYQKKTGHRQQFTKIAIKGIGGAAKSSSKKAEKKSEKPAAASTAKADDLTKIEGVGPKAAEALQAAGFNTYADLSKATADKIKEALSEAGGRLAHLDPSTWAEQAELAANGKWDELKALQDELDGGKKK